MRLSLQINKSVIYKSKHLLGLALKEILRAWHDLARHSEVT